MNKICSKRKEDKSVTEFHKNRGECKICAKKYKEENAEKIKIQKQEYYIINKENILLKQKLYQENNPTLVKETKKKYSHAHKEETKKYHQEHYKNNKEEIREQSKRRYERDKEKISLRHKQWRDNHPDYFAEYQQEYYSDPVNRQKRKENEQKYRYENKDRLAIKRRLRRNERYNKDIEYKIKSLLRTGFHHAIKYGHKYSSIFDILGCSLEEFKLYIKGLWQEEMTWDNWGMGDDKWHIDHILPVASFDMTDFEQQKVCWNYINLRPLWQRDNLSKSDFLPDGTRARNKGNLI